MAETYSVQLPDGRVVTRKLPDNATDRMVRAAFAGVLGKHGFKPQESAVVRPEAKSNEEQWREKLGDQGSISNHRDSIFEQAEETLGDLLGKAMGAQYGKHLAGRTVGALNDLTPLGTVTGAEDGGKQFYTGVKRGDVAQAALGAGVFAMSVLPGSVQRVGKNGIKALLRDESGAIRAWHGSPHDFDKFELSDRTLSTGEGAQAYGHGLYFTDSQRLANAYRKADPDRHVGPGHLYDVEIDAEPEQLLDWEAPLHAQPSSVRDAITPLIDATYGEPNRQFVIDNTKARDFYRDYTGWGRDSAMTAEEANRNLLQKGVKGIRVGPGNGQIVVFDDKLVNILGKY